ncbi:MAG: SMP-30/gluconolactonase/LRE family protein [Actinobacteria bacterium]|nr:MAG: SMP-30/gluconolactonase/LRE family protein [Actinomycetota bacterium]
MRGVQIETLIDGLVLPEGPRWRNGALWFSDIWDDRVCRLSPEGACVTVARLAQPSGLGWLPDGRLLVVAMGARQVFRQEPDGELVVHADLSPFADWPCNDMVVASDGTAYVGHFGWDRQHGTTEPMAASVLRVQPNGAVDVAADDMLFPNGMAITADGATLIVAESSASKVTAFDRRADGSLANRRVLPTSLVLPTTRDAKPYVPTASASTPTELCGCPTPRAAECCACSTAAR